MLAPSKFKLVEQIHASGKQLVLAVTGGGSGAISALVEVPGASASVLEAIVPYAERALADWLGGAPDQASSERTARAMAMASFERARTLAHADAFSLVGVGLTASLATTRPKRGAHRVHVAWQTAHATVALSCELAKGERTRIEEEEIATDLVLDSIAEACGVAAEPLTISAIREAVTRREMQAPPAWSGLLLNERSILFIPSSGTDHVSKLIFPGAFHPIHAGHREMARLAAARYGLPVTFELSITNVDKPPLDLIEIDDRLRQFSGDNLLLTRAPTFAEKAALVARSTFIVGADTIARIADPKYYAGNEARRDAAIETIASHGCRFLVFGRRLDDRFNVLSDLDVPTKLKALCDEVPEEQFRVDVSSTELRRA